MAERAGGLRGERTRPPAGWRPRADAPHRSPAFTLLEVLIALTLVVLLAGLVIPLSIGAIARAAAAEAQPRLEAALAQARLEASRRSAPVRLIAADGGAVLRIEAMLLEEQEPSPEPAALDLAASELDPAPASRLDDPLLPDETSRSAEWVLIDEVQLPKGLLLARAAEGEPGAAAALLGVLTMSDAAPSTPAAPIDEEPFEPFAVATALPDGRLESAAAVEVREERDRARRWRIQIAAWTGAVTLTEVRAGELTESAARAADEDPLPPPPPAHADTPVPGRAR